MTPVQCRMARAALDWGVLDLAKKAGISTQTIVRLERGDALKQPTLDRIRETFEGAGVAFIPENGGGPGVRLARRSDNV
ncbi:helix-turn-helix domain-containing protein [Mesorhizobium sp. B2-5-4]|uniref:helix-turn-helix domain-containing protein n=1 Tax=Mesorhizobium sp. B2-5-4 TaxID=2589926 RepID=UPI001AEDAFEC|nr:helix-turn-helix domain-containing protein [Mesorhizobium sp. B2-5-4]